MINIFTNILASAIRFPNLGIEIASLGQSISVFGFQINYYGMIIGFGMFLGLVIAYREAKRTGQNPEVYIDFGLIAIIAALVGARLYYVAFSWDYYKDNLLKIFNTREGGLAIYGGIIASVIALIIFTRVRKLSFWLMADTASLGLVVGQIIGRWGNFVNREAFGGYTNNLFAMQIPLADASYTTAELMENLVEVGGIPYIQVHPTFLYEAMWNLGVFAVLMLYRKHKKFDGEIFLLYIMLYGIGRFWIEGLRTDQLISDFIGLPISQVLSIVATIIAAGYIILCRVRLKTTKNSKNE